MKKFLQHNPWVQIRFNLEKDVFYLITSVGQRKNSEFPWGIQPQTFGFHASMLYHWATKTKKLICCKSLPFNSQKSLTCNFSLQNPHIIQKTGNKNTQINQVKFLSWSNSKFSSLIYKEMCSSWRGELTIRSWELKSRGILFWYSANEGV